MAAAIALLSKINVAANPDSWRGVAGRVAGTNNNALLVPSVKHN